MSNPNQEIIHEFIETKLENLFREKYEIKEISSLVKSEEEKLKKRLNRPFFIYLMQLYKKKVPNMIYLSESFYEMIGLNSYHTNNIDVWHKNLDEESQVKYVNVIKKLKNSDEIVFSEFVYTHPNGQTKKLFSASKIYSPNINKYHLGIIVEEKFEINRINALQKTKKTKFYTNFSSSLFLKLPISVVVTNIVGQIVYVNPFFEKLTKYTKEEVLGLNPRVLKSGKTPENTYTELWENLTNGKSWEGFFINYKKNNEIYYEKAVIFPQVSDKGAMTKYVALKTDITNEVSLKNKVLQSNKLFNRIITASNVGYILLDNKFKIIALNKYLSELLSINYDDAQRKYLNELEFNQKDSFIRIINQTLKAGKHTETVFIEQQKIYLDVYSEKISENKTLVITKDVSHLKKAEEKLFLRTAQLTNLVNIIPVAIFSIDLDGIIKNFNFRAESFAGEPAIKKDENLLDYFVTKNNQRDVRMGEILLSNTNGLETFFRRHVGSKIKVSVSTTFAKNRVNQDTIFCVVNDISKAHKEKKLLEHKVAEKTIELREALSKEKELNALKTDFISKTSHEFRTPLATISIASEFLKKYSHKLTPEKIDLKLQKIMEQTKKMTDLLDDFLLVEKFKSNKVIFTPEKTELVEFVSKIVEQYAEINKDFEINLTNQTDISYVLIDQRLGTSIFQNVISNAIKYSGKIKKINLRIFKSENYIITEVEDFGIGIPEEFQDKIFSSFNRAENAAAHDGTGLGLSIVKQSVEAHGGKITFTSEINKGTKFLIYLPELQKNS